MEKNIFLVTHGETIVQMGENYYADPQMTSETRNALMRLQSKIPPANEVSEVHIGTGRRQQSVALALGLADHQNCFYSAMWGEAATLARDPHGNKAVLLGTGVLIPYEKYLSPAHMEKPIREIIAALPNNSVICSGRPVLRRLQVPENQWFMGRVYLITVKEDKYLEIKLLE